MQRIEQKKFLKRDVNASFPDRMKLQPLGESPYIWWLTDKNGTSYLTMTGKENKLLLESVGAITVIILLFF